MNTYTIAVKPESDAFAAIQRFDPDALIELEANDEVTETYTITSDYVLDPPARRRHRPRRVG